MARQKLSMSEKIRNQLALGKTPKEISKYLKCSTGLVYAVRSSDKKKSDKAIDLLVEVSRGRGNTDKSKAWKSAQISTSNSKTAENVRNDMLNALATKPGAIRYGDDVFVPKDYAVPKRNFVQRFFNWLCGG